MDATHVHLLLNHVPVLGTAIGLLLLAAAVVRNSDELKKTGLVIFVVSALIVIPTYLTGESAEETVEHLAGVSESIIERHQDAALLSMVALEVLGVVSLASLLLLPLPQRRQVANRLAAISLVLSILTGGLMVRTANLGGQIRHTEIRQGPPAAPVIHGAAHDHDRD